MRNIEYFNTPEGGVLFRGPLQIIKLLEVEDTEAVQFINSKVDSRYAEASAALKTIYSRALPNKRYHDYLKAHRFIRCNLGVYDGVDDIDNEGNLILEEVPCPMRGECKWEGIICKPKVTTSLTKREHEVMKLMYKGKKAPQISDILFISINTVKQHKRNALAKFDLHSVTDFIRYANTNNLFK